MNYTAADPDCWWTWQGCTTPAASTGLSADITTVPEPLTWGLAFDDGPNCSHNALYDFLLENDQKATMWVPLFYKEMLCAAAKRWESKVVDHAHYKPA